MKENIDVGQTIKINKISNGNINVDPHNVIRIEDSPTNVKVMDKLPTANVSVKNIDKTGEKELGQETDSKYLKEKKAIAINTPEYFFRSKVESQHQCVIDDTIDNSISKIKPTENKAPKL